MAIPPNCEVNQFQSFLFSKPIANLSRTEQLIFRQWWQKTLTYAEPIFVSLPFYLLLLTSFEVTPSNISLFCLLTILECKHLCQSADSVGWGYPIRFTSTSMTCTRNEKSSLSSCRYNNDGLSKFPFLQDKHISYSSFVKMSTSWYTIASAEGSATINLWSSCIWESYQASPLLKSISIMRNCFYYCTTYQIPTAWT